MKSITWIFLLSFKLGYSQNVYTSNVQTIEILENYGTTQSNEAMFESITNDEYGNNETVIELSDVHPNVLWNLNDSQEDGKIIIKAEEGYRIVVLIMECSIENKDSYVKISSGGDFNADDSLMFVYNVKEHYTYLFNSNILVVEKHTEQVNSKFTVNFTRIGKKAISTTTPIPTTTIIIPTPRSNDSSELTVYIGGMDPRNFKQVKVVTALKKMLSDMAEAYCKDRQFPLAENITLHNILISKLSACPTNWRNSDKCIELRFAIPVDINEDIPFQWSGYQLTSSHLKIMWERYSEEYLEGLWVYNPPDINSSMRLEIIIGSLVIVIFSIILVALKYILIVKPDKKRRRKLSDTTSIISSNSRHSEVSLPQHYLQEGPSLFDNKYTMYDPTKVGDAFGYFNTATLVDEKEDFPDITAEESSL